MWHAGQPPLLLDQNWTLFEVTWRMDTCAKLGKWLYSVHRLPTPGAIIVFSDKWHMHTVQHPGKHETSTCWLHLYTVSFTHRPFTQTHRYTLPFTQYNEILTRNGVIGAARACTRREKLALRGRAFLAWRTTSGRRGKRREGNENWNSDERLTWEGETVIWEVNMRGWHEKSVPSTRLRGGKAGRERELLNVNVILCFYYFMLIKNKLMLFATSKSAKIKVEEMNLLRLVVYSCKIVNNNLWEEHAVCSVWWDVSCWWEPHIQ